MRKSSRRRNIEKRKTKGTYFSLDNPSLRNASIVRLCHTVICKDVRNSRSQYTKKKLRIKMLQKSKGVHTAGV